MKTPEHGFASWPDLNSPPGTAKSFLEKSKEFDQKRILKRCSVIYGKKLAERKGFSEALNWALRARNPPCSTSEAFNLLAIANEKLQTGDYNFFAMLAKIAKRRSEIKLKLHFYILENHFDWGDTQCSNLTISELVTEIGDLRKDGDYPDPAVVRRACSELGYVWKSEPRGRP